MSEPGFSKLYSSCIERQSTLVRILALPAVRRRVCLHLAESCESMPGVLAVTCRGLAQLAAPVTSATGRLRWACITRDPAERSAILRDLRPDMAERHTEWVHIAVDVGSIPVLRELHAVRPIWPSPSQAVLRGVRKRLRRFNRAARDVGRPAATRALARWCAFLAEVIPTLLPESAVAVLTFLSGAAPEYPAVCSWPSCFFELIVHRWGAGRSRAFLLSVLGLHSKELRSADVMRQLASMPLVRRFAREGPPGWRRAVLDTVVSIWSEDVVQTAFAAGSLPEETVTALRAAGWSPHVASKSSTMEHVVAAAEAAVAGRRSEAHGGGGPRVRTTLDSEWTTVDPDVVAEAIRRFAARREMVLRVADATETDAISWRPAKCVRGIGRAPKTDHSALRATALVVEVLEDMLVAGSATPSEVADAVGQWHVFMQSRVSGFFDATAFPPWQRLPRRMPRARQGLDTQTWIAWCPLVHHLLRLHRPLWKRICPRTVTGPGAKHLRPSALQPLVEKYGCLWTKVFPWPGETPWTGPEFDYTGWVIQKRTIDGR